MALAYGRRRRWRDAVFEGPFGRSPEGTKFAEPKNDRADAVYPALSRMVHHVSCAHSGVRVRRAQEVISPHAPAIL